MSSLQREESSSVLGASAPTPNSASSAASTGVSPGSINTTLTTKVITRTETNTATATGSRTGVSSAISAGIGAGTGIAVAGLILLVVAAAVFFRRRRRRDPNPAPPTTITETSSSAPLALSPEVRPKPTGLAALPKHCRLNGTDDSVVRQRLIHLGQSIKHHAESNDYHRDTILARRDTLHESLCQLQLSEGTRHTIVRLSIDPNTRHIGIRHLLALVIFSNLDTHSVGPLSLLPPALKELFKSLPKASSESQNPLVEPALVVWNRLTAFLMHNNPKSKIPLPLLPSVESQVKALVTLLQRFLVHFTRTDDDGSPVAVQQTRLENAITSCVKFGYHIFSDPYDWKFTFPQEKRGVLVMPGLEKLRDDMGELHDPPRVVSSAEFVTVHLTED